jgi:hypothetical protein
MSGGGAREMGRIFGRKATKRAATPAEKASVLEGGKGNIPQPFFREFSKGVRESGSFDGAQPTNTEESKRATALGRSPVVRTRGTTANKKLLGE